MKETSPKFGFWPEIRLLMFFLSDVFFNLASTKKRYGTYVCDTSYVCDMYMYLIRMYVIRMYVIGGM